MDNIKQINTGVAELLAVKVPEGASDFCVPNDIYLSSLPVLQWWIAKDGIVNEVGSTTLPPGNWTPLGMSDQLTEEQCKELVSKCTINGHSLFGYIKDRELHTKDTAKEAFASLMQANGCYSVNPNGHEDPKHQKGIKYLERLKWRWQQAEANTGTWLILKRLS